MEPALHGIGAEIRSPGAKPSDLLTRIRAVVGMLDRTNPGQEIGRLRAWRPDLCTDPM